MSLNPEWAEQPGLRNRFLILSLVAIGIFLLLVLRLWYLQVISYDRYHSQSEKNRIRYIPVTAPRGAVYDRDGRLLVDNRPAFGISVLRQEVEDKDGLLDRLSQYLAVDKSELLKRWDNGRRFPPYRPVPLADDVSREIMEKIQENSLDLPGVLTEVKPLRAYPYGDMAAHLFGYLGEITERELQEAEPDRYRAGDFVGKSGLEKKLENYLQGVAGERRVEVDVKGKELRALKVQEPTPGEKVFLTLDRDLQLAAEKAFKDQAGAAVVLDVQNGEIMALVSRPSFNPALFAQGITGKDWIKLIQDPRHPLQNKAIQGQYPPGSTFKIVTALAALKAGVASGSMVVDCQGSLPLGNREFRCWKKEGHKKTNLKKALKESCDVWFYKVATDLGIDRLAETARDLGMGQSLGFPLGNEREGLIPTRQWKKERFKEKWYDGETVIAAIGQGYVLATPLQLAVMTAAVANGGKVLRPHVVKKVEDLEGNVEFESEPETINEIEFPEKDIKVVRQGLEAAVNEPGGTAGASRLDGIRVAGKTGTAQVVKLKEDNDKTEDIPYRFRDHALFVSYAPAEAPKVAVAVVVEHGSHGGSVAGPIARAIFVEYFGLESERQEQDEPVPSGD